LPPGDVGVQGPEEFRPLFSRRCHLAPMLPKAEG
jgi:hypothetical protein